MTTELTLLVFMTVGMILQATGALGLYLQLKDAKKLLREESARLDWLDATVTPVVENQGWGNPYGEHVSNAWSVEWPTNSVREAIDIIRFEQQARGAK